MEVNKIYKTKTGKTVEVVKFCEKLEAWLCLRDGYTACWYNGEGVCQEWGADKDPDNNNIDFSQTGNDPPPEVRIPDFLLDEWSLVRRGDSIDIYFDSHRMGGTKPDSKDLVIPMDCYRTVSEFRKMQAVYEKWESEHGEQSQKDKDHAAMERLRKREVAGLWFDFTAGVFRSNIARFVATPDVHSKDPADAINAVKGGE